MCKSPAFAGEGEGARAERIDLADALDARLVCDRVRSLGFVTLHALPFDGEVDVAVLVADRPKVGRRQIDETRATLVVSSARG